VQVKWYHSLRFKLFAILTVLLTLAVAAFAINSGTQFTAVLNEQIRERIGGLAARSQSGVENAVTQWKSVSGTLVQNAIKLQGRDFQSQVESFVASNNQIVAFDVYVTEAGQTPRPLALGASVSKEQASLKSFKREDLLHKIRVESLRYLAKREKDAGDAKDARNARDTKSGGLDNSDRLDRVDLINLQEPTGAPLLLIAIPFNKGSVWALVTVLSENMVASLESSQRSRTWLLRADGTPVLWPAGRKPDDARAFASDPTVMKALSNASQSNTYDGERADGEAYITAFSKSRDGRLVVFVEQDAGEGKKLIYHRLLKFAMLGLIVAWTALGLIYVAMGRATRSIIEAVKATLRIAGGDLAARVNARGRDEIGVLGAAVNHMASQISRLIELQAVAARQEAELRTAQAFQATLFPKRIESGTHFKVTGHYRSASECAGDWWSYYRLSATRTLVLVADATGHGAPAALVGATAFGFFENYARSVITGTREEIAPSALLRAFNDMLWDSGAGRSSMTMFLLMLDSGTGTLTYVNAGHVPCLFIPRDDADERLSRKGRAKKAKPEFENEEITATSATAARLTSTKESPATESAADAATDGAKVGAAPAGKRAAPLLGAGSVVGYGADPQFEEKILPLKVGDRFFLYTDGLVECLGVGGAMMKPSKLREVLGTMAGLQSDEFREAFVSTMDSHFGNEVLDDDVTVVMVDYLDEVLAPIAGVA